MLWLILPFLGLLLFILCGVIAGEEDELGVVIGFVAFVSVGVGMWVIGSGIMTYNTLVGLREEVISLKEEIDTIRSARYEETHSKFVAGSLDNLGQSTALSQYIKTYAMKKAEYNRRLEEAKLKKTTPLYW